MTKTQMTAIVQQRDFDGTITAKLFTALRTGTDDELLNLIESIVTAARTDAADDIVIDLKDFGQDEAAEIVKANYLP